MDKSNLLSILIEELIAERVLTKEQMSQAVEAIASGEANDTQVGGFLAALKMRGQLKGEVLNCRRAMDIMKTLW